MLLRPWLTLCVQVLVLAVPVLSAGVGSMAPAIKLTYFDIEGVAEKVPPPPWSPPRVLTSVDRCLRPRHSCCDTFLAGAHIFKHCEAVRMRINLNMPRHAQLMKMHAR